jgi:tripartite-type tricarboxylate transporter receptor subunit TctC
VTAVRPFPVRGATRAGASPRRAARFLLAAVALFASLGTALAQGYQSRPIRIVVPNAPGGPTDIVGRIVGQKFAERVGVAVVVDNRAGASGTLGGDVVAKAAPDGHTLLLASSSAFVSTPILVPNAPFDSRRDLAPVTIVVSVPYVLLVNPASGIQSVKELVAQARARPGTLNYGTAGNGSTSHLASAMLGVLAGIDIVHVPYKGSAPAATDLIGGQLQFVIEAIAGGMQHVRSGRLRALGISSRQRVASLPDVPTIAEAGVPGYEATVSHGICAPAKTPAAMIDQLNRDLVAAIRTPEARERLAAIGAQVVASSAEAYRDTIRDEIARWEKLVREIAAKGR